MEIIEIIQKKKELEQKKEEIERTEREVEEKRERNIIIELVKRYRNIVEKRGNEFQHFEFNGTMIRSFPSPPFISSALLSTFLENRQPIHIHKYYDEEHKVYDLSEEDIRLLLRLDSSNIDRNDYIDGRWKKIKERYERLKKIEENPLLFSVEEITKLVPISYVHRYIEEARDELLQLLVQLVVKDKEEEISSIITELIEKDQQFLEDYNRIKKALQDNIERIKLYKQFFQRQNYTTYNSV